MVNQVSSAWFDNKLLRKSYHNETNFNKCEFTEKFCEFISLLLNMCKIAENRQNYVGFDCRIFPLGLNTLDNAGENEICLQLYQSYKQGRIYRCGEFYHIFQFESWVCGYLYEVSLSLSYWLNF